MAYDKCDLELSSELARARELLSYLESSRNIAVVAAFEAGSAAYGLRGPESDYDVRFLFAYPTAAYLSLDSPALDITYSRDGMDIVGWEVRKALRLARKSNLRLLEWLHGQKIRNPFNFDRHDFSDLALKCFSSHVCAKSCLGELTRVLKTVERESVFSPKALMTITRRAMQAYYFANTQRFPPLNFFTLCNHFMFREVKEKAIELAELLKKGEVKEIFREDWLVLLEYAEQCLKDLRVLEVRHENAASPAVSDFDYLLLSILRHSEGVDIPSYTPPARKALWS